MAVPPQDRDHDGGKSLTIGATAAVLLGHKHGCADGQGGPTLWVQGNASAALIQVGVENVNEFAELAYVSSAKPAGKFSELDCVRLLRAVEARDHRLVARGSKGAIVAVYADGDAYEVEFVEPVQALATVGAEDIELSE